MVETKERNVKEAEVEKEKEAVSSWNRQFLAELLGPDYTDEGIEAFIDGGISPWDVKKLLDKDCPVNLVGKILL